MWPQILMIIAVAGTILGLWGAFAIGELYDIPFRQFWKDLWRIKWRRRTLLGGCFAYIFLALIYIYSPITILYEDSICEYSLGAWDVEQYSLDQVERTELRSEYFKRDGDELILRIWRDGKRMISF